MSKTLKWVIIIVLALGLGLFGAFKWMQSETKKYSPEETITYQKDGFDLKLYYNRPYKKDRVIFGELVPYGEVWRTGANEPTTFSSASDLVVAGQKLPAGQYTLWTIPGKESWQVIFNDKQYAWGVTWGSRAAREMEFDLLNVEIPVESLNQSIEQFTIEFLPEKGEQVYLRLRWDEVQITVPLAKA